MIKKRTVKTNPEDLEYDALGKAVKAVGKSRDQLAEGDQQQIEHPVRAAEDVPVRVEVLHTSHRRTWRPRRFRRRIERVWVCIRHDNPFLGGQASGLGLHVQQSGRGPDSCTNRVAEFANRVAEFAKIQHATVPIRCFVKASNHHCL